ncbi:MAG: peptidylprolyl isomerase [Nanoarchaeota archaeon]
MAIKKGDKVKVEYTGKLEDGTVFDSSEGKQPLEFTAGEGQLIKGFDNAVIGMNKGDEKEVKIPAAEAYGEINPQFMRKIPRASLPQDKEPKVNMMLIMSTGNGQQIPARISAVDDKEVTLDLNHPLAGNTLIFKIKVVEC